MSGDTGPAQKRTPQKAATVTKKTVSSVSPKAKTPELRKSSPTKKETAAEFRARKANELKAAKAKQLAKQKKVTLQKEADTYKPGKKLGTPKKPRYTGSDSSGVENKEATKRSGVKQYYSKAENDSNKTKEMNARTLAKRKARSKN
jgi:hypothetical protein